MRFLVLWALGCLLPAQAPVVPPEPARILLFQATPPAVNRGGTVTLRWFATGTDRVLLEPVGREFPARGTVTQIVTGRSVFWLHAANAKGGQSTPLVVEQLAEASPDLQAPPRSTGRAVQPARASGPAGAWIQFAALAEPANLARLRRALRRFETITGALSVTEARGVQGRNASILRAGPFPSLQEARKRLQVLKPRIRSLHIRPFVALEPGPAHG